MIRAQPNAALTELLKQTGELDRILDGRGLQFTPAKGPPPPPPPPQFVIPPFDTSSFVTLPREPGPALHVEDEETLPAKPRPKSATPNLDRWRRELMRPAS